MYTRCDDDDLLTFYYCSLLFYIHLIMCAIDTSTKMLNRINSVCSNNKSEYEEDNV